MRWPKWTLKALGPAVCRFRGHVEVTVTGYETGHVSTMTGCTRCLRGLGFRDTAAAQYPRPRAKVVVRR